MRDNKRDDEQRWQPPRWQPPHAADQSDTGFPASPLSPLSPVDHAAGPRDGSTPPRPSPPDPSTLDGASRRAFLKAVVVGSSAVATAGAVAGLALSQRGSLASSRSLVQPSAVAPATAM